MISHTLTSFKIGNFIKMEEIDTDKNETKNIIEFDEPAAPILMDDGNKKDLKVRLDKWLWAVRFFKTRAIARSAIENKKVFYNNEIVKPSTEIKIGDKVQIKQSGFTKVVLITGLSTRRRNADDANALYKEIKTRKEHDYSSRTYNSYNYKGNGNINGNLINSNVNGNTLGSTNFNNRTSSSQPRKAVRFLRRAFSRSDEQANLINGDDYPY